MNSANNGSSGAAGAVLATSLSSTASALNVGLTDAPLRVISSSKGGNQEAISAAEADLGRAPGTDDAVGTDVVGTDPALAARGLGGLR